MTKFVEIKNADVILVAGPTVASNWTEQKLGFITARSFSKSAGHPLIFCCIAEIKQSALTDREKRAEEAARFVFRKLDLATLDGVNAIEAYWGPYKDRDSVYYVEGYLNDKSILLLDIEVTDLFSYHDFTVTAFAEKPYESLACMLVGAAIAKLNPFATKYRGK